MTFKHFALYSSFFFLLMTFQGCDKDEITVIPSVSTLSTNNVTSTGAECVGLITKDGGAAILLKGVCWNTKPAPTNDLLTKTENGPGPQSFTATLTDLLPGTKYYVRAYATNEVGIAYGNELTFTTLTTLALLSTSAVTVDSPTSAKTGGKIISDGGLEITSRGVCWGKNTGPTIESSSKTTDGSGNDPFASTLTGLAPGTTYFVRAYAVSTKGVAYGNELTFTTHQAKPELSTAPITELQATSVVTGGNVTSDGGAPVTSRGVCWSLDQSPTIEISSKMLSGQGTGLFVSQIQGLIPVTTYYVRAFATNGVGTSYGPQISFTTEAALAQVSTAQVTAVSSNSAASGGSIISDGGLQVTVRGVCWSKFANPTIDNSSKTVNGSGNESFVSYLTGLDPGTAYYLRAYAVTAKGTAYGNQLTFQTAVTKPEVSTTIVSFVTGVTASSGGNVTSDGGSPVIQRGICWSTTHEPTVDLNSKAVSGSGIGSFSVQMTGLQVGTVYYVRAFATNHAGTSYGNEISFTTEASLYQYFVDIRDSRQYKIVTIGTQTWMAENLNFDATIDDFSYNNNSSNETVYGRLYSWEVAKTSCPSGWHLPTGAEWQTLTTLVGEAQAGVILKDKSTAYWTAPNNGQDLYGFSMLPGGFKSGSSFYGLGTIASFWTANSNANNAFYMTAEQNSNYVAPRFDAWKDNQSANSIRCIKD